MVGWGDHAVNTQISLFEARAITNAPYYNRIDARSPGSYESVPDEYELSSNESMMIQNEMPPIEMITVVFKSTQSVLSLDKFEKVFDKSFTRWYYVEHN